MRRPKDSAPATKESPGTAGPQQPGSSRPCKEAQACQWLEKFVDSKTDADPSWAHPRTQFWLNDLYKGYAELYLAVARLEKKEFGLPTKAADSIVSPPGPNPGPNKAGSPPPPGFP